MKKIILVGHKNPDTDSIVAPLAFADFLKKVREPILGFSFSNIKVARAGQFNRETEFILSHFKQKKPPFIKSVQNKNVVLLDHGDYGQAVDGIEKANLLGVLDHHKLGGLKTTTPIFYRVEPLGSSSSLVAKMFFENNRCPNKKIAGLLLAGILSDTLKFTSPTTTVYDKKVAKVLARISGENPKKLAKEMFEAKSDITGIFPQDLVSKDYKEYKQGKITFGFGVWETTSSWKVEEMKEKIFLALEKLKKKRKLDLVFFALVDIMNKNSKLFLLGEKEKLIAKKAFHKPISGNFLCLPGIVSRKKQMLPPVLKILEKNGNPF